MSIYDDRLCRIRNAVAMKPVDRIPFSYNGPAFTAKAGGMLMKDYISDFPEAARVMLDVTSRLGGVDSIQTPVMSPYTLSTVWMSGVSVPGVELPDDELWQVEEKESIVFDDYEYILKHGFGEFHSLIMGRLLGDVSEKLGPFFNYMPVATERMKQAGIPVINGGNTGTPIEYLCGGRGMSNFFIDLVEEPELVKKVLDSAMIYCRESFISQLEAAKPFGAWIGGWRGAPELISHDMWAEYVWPYMKELANIAIARGVVPIFHLDSNWNREFKAFLELPPRKSILALDGKSDMRLARSILGDHSCLMGDVPASLLAFDTPEAVYDYTVRLISDVGPETGLIVSSGCDIPCNARFENVRAMVEAAAGYR